MAVAREDHDDEVYRTTQERARAVIREIEEAHAKGQPLLSAPPPSRSPSCSPRS